MVVGVNHQIKHLINKNITLNVENKSWWIDKYWTYHVVILDTTTFLEKTGNRKGNIFWWPMRISLSKCFKPEKAKDSLQLIKDIKDDSQKLDWEHSIVFCVTLRIKVNLYNKWSKVSNANFKRGEACRDKRWIAKLPARPIFSPNFGLLGRKRFELITVEGVTSINLQKKKKCHFCAEC